MLAVCVGRVFVWQIGKGSKEMKLSQPQHKRVGAVEIVIKFKANKHHQYCQEVNCVPWECFYFMLTKNLPNVSSACLLANSDTVQVTIRIYIYI